MDHYSSEINSARYNNDAKWSPSVAINSYSKNEKFHNKLIGTVPGNTTYIDIINKGKKAKIFCGSMIKVLVTKNLIFI